MNYYIISFSVTALISFLIALFVLSRNTQSKLNITFSFYSLSVFFWAFFYVLFSFAKDYQEALLWNKWLMAGAIFIPAFFMHFILVYLDLDKKHKNIIFFNYALCILFLSILPSHLFIKSIIPLYGFQFWPHPGYLFHPYFAWFAINIVVAHLLLLTELLKAKGTRRAQISFVFLGTLVAFTGGSTNFFMWYRIPIPPIGSPFVAMYVILIAYAITKHELMDIRVAITRTAAYGVVGVLLIGSFMGFNSFQLPMIAQIIGNTLLGIFWAITAHRLRLFIQTPLEEKWVTDFYNSDVLINSIAQKLVPVLERKGVFTTIAAILKEKIKIKEISIVLAEKDHQTKPVKYILLDQEGEDTQTALAADHPFINELKDVCHYDNLDKGQKKNLEQYDFLKGKFFIPLSSADALEGIIVLNQKVSEDGYNEKDITLFRTIMIQAQVILDRIRPYERIKEEFATNQQQLFETQQQLERQAHLASLGTLSAGVAHEIRNPMTVLRSKAQKLVNKLEDKEYLKEYAALSIKHIDRILEIIKGMLDQAKTRQIEKKLIDVNGVIEETLKFIPVGTIKIEKNLAELPETLADPGKLFQVFVNLVQNATKAMQSTGGTLTITSSVAEDQIKIDVTDTGIGIPEEQLKQVFEPFFTTTHEGVGLGLSTSNRIISDHGGRFEVKSKVGQGSTFTIYLPVQTA